MPIAQETPASLRNPDEASFELLVQSVRDYAIIMLDPQGRVTSWNAGAERIKGWRAAEILGRSFEAFYPPEAIAVGWPGTELQCATTSGRFEDCGWRVRKDGSRFWANVVITAIRGPQGQLIGFGKFTRDLTAEREQKEALRRSEAQFRLLVESVKDHALFMVDPSGIVHTWNAGASTLYGHAAKDVVGRHVALFFTEQDRALNRPQCDLDNARRDGCAATSVLQVRRDGSLFWAEVKLNAMRHADGELLGFAQVTRDLTERRHLDDLEVARQRMTHFFAMLAHELRNPLAPIRNAVEILRLQNDLSPVLVHVRDVIDRQASLLTRLVDDLLDVGRAATGKLVLKAEWLDYREVLRTAVETVTPAATAKAQRLEVSLPRAPVFLLGDGARLVQALQNVLGNAVRYTPRHGEIQVDVRLESASVLTAISDNGVGIEHDALERIFDLFVQGQSPQATSESGLGIGLSLTRSLVARHGGVITAHSPGPGQGSTFLIRLPRASGQPGPCKPPAQGGLTRVRPRRILVADDDADAADSLCAMLKLLGNEVVVTHHGIEALAACRVFEPECALIDLDMPHMDGFTLLRLLRATPGLDELRAAAVTGFGLASDHDRTRAAGFDAHLTKPVGLEALKRFLNGA